MTTKMTAAHLDLVDETHPQRQRVAVLEEPGRIVSAWARIPEPGPGEIRLRVNYVGICGSDIESFTGRRTPEFLTTPTRLGHEVAGVIDKLGPGVAGLQVGDRVACRYVWGAFAQYITCKPFNVKVVPPHLGDETVSPIEVLPGILHALDRAAIDQTKSVLIMGQGVSGLLLTKVAALHSPRALAVTDLRDHKLAKAREYGATHSYKLASPDASTREATEADFPAGFDVVIPCLLDGDGVVDALDCVAMCGKIVLYGCIGPCNKPFDFLKLHRRRADILSTEPRRDLDMRNYFDQSLQLVLDGLVDPADIVTDIVPLAEVDRAFDLRLSADGRTIHVLVDCR